MFSYFTHCALLPCQTLCINTQSLILLRDMLGARHDIPLTSVEMTHTFALIQEILLLSLASFCQSRAISALSGQGKTTHCHDQWHNFGSHILPPPPPPPPQGFSQDFRIGCSKIHVWGELGVQFSFTPLHYTQKL